MILKDNQYITICVRAIIIEAGELLLTEWTTASSSFLIGGRVDFGEPISKALHREVYEETGAKIKTAKFVYFSEHAFRYETKEIQEYGWYFYVELDHRTVCQPGQVIPNPDHSSLIIRHAPLTEAGLQNIRPHFLRQYLPDDVKNQFQHAPRYLHSSNLETDDFETQDFSEAFN
jgi:8-oxo-dGTP pyrophosphatase MutT (NUDIX family)